MAAQDPGVAPPSATAAPIPMIGDSTPLGRFSQPILPPVTKAPTGMERERDTMLAKVNEDQDARQRPFGFAGSAPDAQHPNGLAPNHPGFWGETGHILGRIGNIAGDIFAPGTMALIHGTELNNDLRDSRDLHHYRELAQDASTENDQAAKTAQTEQQTTEMPGAAADKHGLDQATIDNLKSETDARNNPQPSLANAYAHAVQDALKNGRDPSTDPVVGHLADAITSLQPGQNKAPDAPKTITAVRPGSPKPHEWGWNAKTNAYDIDEGEHYEKPQVVNVNAGDAALDRDIKQFGAGHQKSLDTANAQLDKIADARAMINGNAESQGLGIPKVLTALVGGQGTGVRITQAELTSIAHARGISGDVEGTLNKWAGKGALSSQQQQQLTEILDDVKARILQKQAIASGALDTINGASSRGQIIEADKAARKQLSDLESGAGAAPKEGTTKTNSDGDKIVFKSGKWGPA